MNPANRPAMKVSVLRIFVIFFLPFVPALVSAQGDGFVSGKIVSAENNGAIPYATVFLKETRYGASTDTSGLYGFKAPAGDYSLVVSAIGYERIEKPVRLTPGSRTKISLALTPKTTEMEEVVVLGSGVGRVNKSSFNAVAIGTQELQNSTKNLSEALAGAPGLKLRESGAWGRTCNCLWTASAANTSKFSSTGSRRKASEIHSG